MKGIVRLHNGEYSITYYDFTKPDVEYKKLALHPYYQNDDCVYKKELLKAINIYVDFDIVNYLGGKVAEIEGMPIPKNNISQTKKVKLISITKSLIPNHENITPEELIVYCARVSNPENQENFETSGKLISFLIKHKHWSPFEMVDMTLEIKTSRAIAAQILRHRSFSFQEWSMRYSLADKSTEIEIRKKAEKNRQSSEDEFYFDINGKSASEIVKNHIDVSFELYNSLIAAGVAKECARMILPLSTETTLYMKGSIRSWIHYFQIRCEQNTQLEHRRVAMEAFEIFKKNFPVISSLI